MGAQRIVLRAGAACAVAVLSLGAEGSAQQCASPDIPAATLRAIEPTYPEEARRRGVYGSVEVVVSIDEQGRVTYARIQRSPSPLLNDAALAAARRSTFRAPMHDCRPVRGDFLFIATFQPDVPIASVVFEGSADAPTVTVVDLGSATRAPDLAMMTFAFHAVGSSAQVASDAVLAAFTDFLHTARGTGLPDSAVTADAVTVRQRNSTDYEAWRSASVRATAGVQALLTGQAAAAAGATSASVEYAVSDSGSLAAEALEAARRAAYSRAREAAGSRSLVLGDVVRVEPLPYHEDPATDRTFIHFSQDGPSIPDPPATLTARAAVRVTYALHH